MTIDGIKEEIINFYHSMGKIWMIFIEIITIFAFIAMKDYIYFFKDEGHEFEIYFLIVLLIFCLYSYFNDNDFRIYGMVFGVFMIYVVIFTLVLTFVDSYSSKFPLLAYDENGIIFENLISGEEYIFEVNGNKICRVNEIAHDTNGIYVRYTKDITVGHGWERVEMTLKVAIIHDGKMRAIDHIRPGWFDSLPSILDNMNHALKFVSTWNLK